MRPVIWRFEQLAARIGVLAQAARQTGAPVIAVQQTGPPGSPFDPETPGWRLSPAISIQDGDLCVRKTATDSFYQTDLAALLNQHAITTIVIAGAATDYCVDATTRSAISHNFNVDLVSDAHAPAVQGDPDAGLSAEQIIEHHNQVLSQGIHPGGQVSLIASSGAFPL